MSDKIRTIYIGHEGLNKKKRKKNGNGTKSHPPLWYLQKAKKVSPK